MRGEAKDARLLRGGDDGGHAAGDTVVAAVGVEILGVAEGAKRVGVDGGDAGGFELGADGVLEVDVWFLIRDSVDGVGEALVRKFGGDFFADFEVGGGDTGADGGDDVLRGGAGFMEGAEGFGDDVADDTAPAGVGCGDELAVVRGEENRHAVGDTDREQHIGDSRDEGVRGDLAGKAVPEFGIKRFSVFVFRLTLGGARPERPSALPHSPLARHVGHRESLLQGGDNFLEKVLVGVLGRLTGGGGCRGLRRIKGRRRDTARGGVEKACGTASGGGGGARIAT